MATTAFCNSAKVELMEAAHCFNAIVAISANTHTTTTIDTLASTAGLSVGMGVSGSGVVAGTILSRITSATAVVVDVATTSTLTGTTITFTADSFFIALVKVSPVRTFDGTQTNIGTPGTSAASTSNLGTDEVSIGSGYISGGQALTANILPALSSTTATTSWTTNPSWTASSFSTTAGIIYNNTIRAGAAAAPLNGRTIGVFDFGGTQTVSAGTFTLLMPTNNSSTAILRIA